MQCSWGLKDQTSSRRTTPAILSLLLALCSSLPLTTQAQTTAAAPAASAPAGPTALKIGFICPLSGGSADFGNSARLGAELAVREVNEVGGYMGRPVQLVARDDKANPDEGRRVSEALLNTDKVAFTVGFCNTGVAMKSLELFQQQQQVLMVPVATGSAITARYPAAESYVFRMSPRDTLQARFLINEAVQRRGLKKIAFFADTTGYGEGGLTDLTKFLGEQGLKPCMWRVSSWA